MPRFFSKFSLILVVALQFHLGYSQDSLLFEDGSIMKGRIKSLNKATLTVKTHYSKQDFKIKREKLLRMYTTNTYLITAEELNGKTRRYFGRLTSIDDSTILITTRMSLQYRFRNKDILTLDPLGEKFRDKFDATMSVGFDITKANNLATFNAQADADYRTMKWYFQGSYSILRSNQETGDLIRREEGNTGITHFLSGDWFLVLNFNTLSNAELDLKFRNKTQLSVGRYLLRNNTLSLAGIAGVNQNIERFVGDSTNKGSLESIIGINFGFYTSERFDITLKVNAYPGIAKTNRYRTDASIDSRIKITSDFYFSVSSSYNFDNKPAQGAENSDYVIKTGIGWKFK